MTDKRDEFDNFKEACYRSLRNNKLLKTLRHVEIPSDFQSYAFESLKGSKRIQTISVSLDNQITARNGDNCIRFQKLAHYIKRFPVSIHTIHLDIFEKSNIMNQAIYDLARSIRFLPNLKYFQRHCRFDNEFAMNHVAEELRIYNKSVRRLKKMDGMAYRVGKNESDSFKRAMRNGNMSYPMISALRIDLDSSDFPNYDRIMRNFNQGNHFDFNRLNDEQKFCYWRIQEEIKDRDEEKEDNGDARSVVNWDFEDDDEDFVNACLWREEVRPLFRFGLFPNLKKLILKQKADFYPLGSFVIDGFAALKNLESLEIDIGGESSSVDPIFEGLLKLPLLKEFSLSITCLKNDQWPTLKKFLKKQKNLESLTLSDNRFSLSKEDFRKENSHLKSIVKDLVNKPLLKSLYLKSSVWSLKVLSEGLAGLPMTNQLQSFGFKGSDVSLLKSENLQERLEGLCDFIRNQKGSLEHLEVELPYIFDVKVVNTIAQALSELLCLKRFVLSWNFEGSLEQIQNTVSEGKIPSDKLGVLWRPGIKLAIPILRLENLEEFSLYFYNEPKDSTSMTWLVELMRIFPDLKRLRHLHVETFSKGAIEKVEQQVISAIKEITQIVHIGLFHSDSQTFEENFPDLRQTLIEVYEKQARRCDLMF